MSDCCFGVSPVNYPDPGVGMVSHYVIMEYCVLHPRSDSRNWPRSSEYVAAIIDFVTIGLVVVLCLGYGQLASWSVRP